MNQERTPFREQREAAGHAVRGNHLYSGAADVFSETGDNSLFSALDAIWNDLVAPKMYITGATGALFAGTSPSTHGNYFRFETDAHPIYRGRMPNQAVTRTAWVTAPSGPRVTTQNRDEWGSTLYREVRSEYSEVVNARLIPYFCWDNRGLVDMSVWTPVV